MKFEVLGIAHRSGTFNGNDYDNYIVHVAYDLPDQPNVQGRLTDSIKIPAKLYRNDVFVGGFFEPSYDKYGRLTGYSVV